jgi:hypothetical protein
LRTAIDYFESNYATEAALAAKEITWLQAQERITDWHTTPIIAEVGVTLTIEELIMRAIDSLLKEDSNEG